MEPQVIENKIIEFQPRSSFTVMSRGRVINIQFDEISHISKYGNETVIYTASDSYRTYHSLQEILNDLPVNDFFRVHKSHVISLRYMDGMKRGRIKVGEYYLPVSKYYKIEIVTRLSSIINTQLLFF